MIPRSVSSSKSRSPATAARAALLFSAVLIVGVVISAHLIRNTFMISTTAATTATTVASTLNLVRAPTASQSHPPHPTKLPQRAALIPFKCPAGNRTTRHICRSTAPISPPLPLPQTDALPSCPDYFRWIHEDLRPWKSTGITRDMVQRAARTATFRLVVLGGRAYLQRYRRAFQTRDVFTLWGILQLLRRYPGRVPDLDLMFDCVDWPVVQAADYRGRNASAPPPLFRYCSDESSLDIVFPDWSFWGWPEINIKPWEALSRELKEGNRRVRWMDREPYAYWKGNPAVAATRQELLRCNISEGRDWNARLYAQDWSSEVTRGFKESDLASQCTHRYKIYIEGSAWSVSEKYILACDSVPLVVRPRYHDFFTRGLMPVHHYWPIRDEDKCRSIKFAVDWGNTHRQKAHAIGREASGFIQEQLKMDYVYDYMFHLLSEYANLLRYKPTIPRKAVELCSESMACPSEGTKREFMMESMVKAPHDSGLCSLPPPYSPVELRMLQRRKANSIKQVEMWEQKDWESNGNKF